MREQGNLTAEQKFNDDLLLTDEDRNLAAKSFPRLIHILDFPELRQFFERYEEPARQGKTRRRRVGLAALFLGVLALLSASAEPLYKDVPEPWLGRIGLVSAILGIASVSIGGLGVVKSGSKHQWLLGRLMTERLRQFQFQILVYRLPSVVASLQGPAAAQSFFAVRERWFATFRLDHDGHLPGKLKDVLDDNAEEEFWLHDREDFVVPANEERVPDDVFAAYRLLRLQHQIQYANYKLRDEGIGAAMRQVALLSGISLVCILIVFAAHFMIAVSLATAWLEFARGPLVRVFIIWTAIIALAARALEEGLQPTREIERYTRYRSRLQRLLYNYDHAPDRTEKVRVMRETERAVYQEMRAFLRTNDEARFII